MSGVARQPSSVLEGHPVEIAVQFSEEAVELFPTRFVHRRFSGVAALNARLRQIILERAATTPGVTRSNIGGWHSQSDFLRWAAPEVEVLVALFRATVEQCVALELGVPRIPEHLTIGLEAWANVARSGDYVAPHVHPRANFALVYYVDPGDPALEGELSGELELLDPRNRVQMVGGPGTDERDAFRVRPLPGSLVAFPAWLYHYVHPYRGERPRICVACNAVVTARSGQAAQP
jgi:uncharacterized protein (TIGR02466 family)